MKNDFIWGNTFQSFIRAPLKQKAWDYNSDHRSDVSKVQNNRGGLREYPSLAASSQGGGEGEQGGSHGPGGLWPLREAPIPIGVTTAWVVWEVWKPNEKRQLKMLKEKKNVSSN